MSEPNAFVEAKVTVEGKTETAVFTPVDVSGNRGASTAPVTFKAPGPATP